MKKLYDPRPFSDVVEPLISTKLTGQALVSRYYAIAQTMIQAISHTFTLRPLR